MLSEDQLKKRAGKKEAAQGNEPNLEDLNITFKSVPVSSRKESDSLTIAELRYRIHSLENLVDNMTQTITLANNMIEAQNKIIESYSFIINHFMNQPEE